MISSSPLKLGRSSKVRKKSPCSPQVVGDADAGADVLLAAEVVEILELEMFESSDVLALEVGLDDDAASWP